MKTNIDENSLLKHIMFLGRLGKLDLIESELWDHYSGLPNPSWYEYKKR